MDGAFVGTWRPHRPRGLISAQFTSPGPKYSVQGTTGYINHNPTKVKAPAYTCRGAKAPAEGGCSPGPRYYVEPSMTRTGKYVAPAYAITGLPRIKTEITPGPSDYSPEKSNRHIFKCPPEPSMAFRNRGVKTDFTPGPGTYTLPRVMGPNTAHTPASPCYSMKSRSQRDRYDADLAKTPGPAALPKIELDVFKTRAPGYTMGTRTQLRDRTVKPGPADYRTGRVRQPPSAPARLCQSISPSAGAALSCTVSCCSDTLQDSPPVPSLVPSPAGGRQGTLLYLTRDKQTQLPAFLMLGRRIWRGQESSKSGWSSTSSGLRPSFSHQL
ncbi:ciliary microtubule associated protein 1A-like isoform X1 [Columba livia]|uniref:ciliary microtubule associated protein 1A-like isoform X1 n=1 Tax=Columba livia TaxID=8932 RepID=UPI0031BA7A91